MDFGKPWTLESQYLPVLRIFRYEIILRRSEVFICKLKSQFSFLIYVSDETLANTTIMEGNNGKQKCIFLLTFKHFSLLNYNTIIQFRYIIFKKKHLSFTFCIAALLDKR